MIVGVSNFFFFFFFNDTATTEIYTLSLHDALPICDDETALFHDGQLGVGRVGTAGDQRADRKSTRLNSSHLVISYAVFCLKKKKNIIINVKLSTSNPYQLLPISRL